MIASFLGTLNLHKQRMSWREILLLLLPFFCFFSYHPVISFGSGHGMYFEFSVLQIFLVFFVAVNLSSIWKNRDAWMQNRFAWGLFIFCCANAISLLWSDNFVKGFLITGMLYLLFLVFLAILSYSRLRELAPILLKSCFVNTLIFGVFALGQFVIGSLNASQDITLLCDGCVASQLGFPRVSGLFVEPQFLGSIMLIPIFLSFYIFASRLSEKLKIQQGLILVIASLSLLVLFLTLSRGAIYAFALGLVAFIIIFYKNFKRVALMVGLSVLVFASSLVLQGISANTNPNIDINFTEATTRVVHQLSLGIIDLRPKAMEPKNTDPEVTADQNELEEAGQEDISKEPNFDGYIEESTEDRLLMSRLAIDAWRKTPSNVLIGTGVGSTGYALAKYFPDQTGDTEITQNQYTETLLENGLIGFILLVILVVLVFWATRQVKFLWPIWVTFLAQWLFFSGLPNALHLYIFTFIGLAYAFSLAKKQNKTLNR